MYDLGCRVALVTGSTRGIGVAIARRLAAGGAKVVVSGRSAEAGQRVVDSIVGASGQARFVPLDLGVETGVERAVEAAVEAHGRLDVLVNNAAPTDLVTSGVDRPVTELTTEDLSRILLPGLYGNFWACKYALPHLIASGAGSVVNVSSMAAVIGMPGLPGYTMSKGALAALSRQIAVEYAPAVRSNTIVIGFVVSGEIAAAIASDPAMGAALRDATLTRAGTTADIAEAAAYLAGEASGYITGSEIKLDGGLLCGRNLPDVATALAD